MSELFNEIKESLTMQQVARHFGYEPNRSGFIHSPFGEDKTASCKLYKNSFYDFSTNTGGDLIKFTAALNGQNNWQACQYLVEAFSLPFSLSGHTDNREQIERRKRERERQQERERNFKAAWRAEVDRLKALEEIYTAAIENKIYPPLSDMQAYVVGELQKVSYALDILCGLVGSRQDIEELLKQRGYAL